MSAVAGTLAAIQLGMSLWGHWKNQKAEEEARDKEAQRLAQLRRLGIKKFEHQQGIALNTLSQLDRQQSRADDIEQNVMFEKSLELMRQKGKIKSLDLMSGQSTVFFTNRTTGDTLRSTEAIKDDFSMKRVNTYFKKESVMDGLKADRINMEYALAGLSPPGSSDRTQMYLAMVNSGFNSLGTYYKYKDVNFGSPETNTTYGGGMGENA